MTCVKRTAQVAAAIAIVLLLVAVVYIADPQLLGMKGSGSSSGGSSATVSEGATLTASTQGGGGQSAGVSVGASATASTQSSTA